MQIPSSIDAINEMLQMQNALNEMTNGADWRSGVTQLGKVIDWKRCIVMESAELIDSYPWKHWKSVDAVTDIENVRVELVDIWHFLLSLMLEHCELEPSARLLENALQSNKGVSSDMGVINQVAIHETMMSTALESGVVSKAYLSRLAGHFFNSCSVAELDFARLYQLYMAKNVLNKFRQDHGYKEGTYIKEWQGKEDNTVMFELMAKMPSFSGDELYRALKASYTQLNIT